MNLSMDRVQWHLENWAEWCEGERVGSGYRNRASGGLVGYGSSDFDAMVKRADATCAAAVDACIKDLPASQQRAIDNKMLACVHRMREDSDLLFTVAKMVLARTIAAKGID